MNLHISSDVENKGKEHDWALTAMILDAEAVVVDLRKLIHHSANKQHYASRMSMLPHGVYTPQEATTMLNIIAEEMGHPEEMNLSRLAQFADHSQEEVQDDYPHGDCSADLHDLFHLICNSFNQPFAGQIRQRLKQFVV